MESSRFSFAGLCIALIDFVLVVVLAVIGTAWWQVARFVYGPKHYVHDLLGATGLMAAATLVAVCVFWSVARRLSFLQPRSRKLFGAGVVAALGVIAFLKVRGIDLEQTSSGDGDRTSLNVLMAGGAFLLLLVVFHCALKLLPKQRSSAFVGRAVLALGMAGYLVYLARDEAPSPAIARNHEVLAGRSEDDASRLLTLRYSPGVEGSKTFTPLTHTLVLNHKDAAQRRTYLLAHRAEIEANWEELAEVRAWCAEMAAQPVLGDRPYDTFDAPILKFQAVREYTQHAFAMAGLAALDGNGDRASEMIQEVYVLGARLEPEACTLVRGMIAVVLQKHALETLEFVLDHTTVSPERVGRLIAALSKTEAAGLGAKRIVLLDASSRLWTGEGMRSWVAVGGDPFTGGGTLGQRMAGWVSPMVFNPHATANALHEQTERLSLAAEARDLEAMADLSEDLYRDVRRLRLKNWAGRQLLEMSFPAYQKVVESYWKTEDLRVAMIERLRTASAL